MSDQKEWVARILDKHWKSKFDTYEQMVAGVWAATPGKGLMAKLSVLMLDLPKQHRHGRRDYVPYNHVCELVHALDTDRKVPDAPEMVTEYALLRPDGTVFHGPMEDGPWILALAPRFPECRVVTRMRAVRPYATEWVDAPDTEVPDLPEWDKCPDCGAPKRVKSLQEGGGVECGARCGWWFCY